MIRNLTKKTEFKGQAFPPFMQKIIDAEGLVNYINARQFFIGNVKKGVKKNGKTETRAGI